MYNYSNKKSAPHWKESLFFSEDMKDRYHKKKHRVAFAYYHIYNMNGAAPLDFYLKRMGEKVEALNNGFNDGVLSKLNVKIESIREKHINLTKLGNRHTFYDRDMKNVTAFAYRHFIVENWVEHDRKFNYYPTKLVSRIVKNFQYPDEGWKKEEGERLIRETALMDKRKTRMLLISRAIGKRRWLVPRDVKDEIMDHVKDKDLSARNHDHIIPLMQALGYEKDVKSLKKLLFNETLGVANTALGKLYPKKYEGEKMDGSAFMPLWNHANPKIRERLERDFYHNVVKLDCDLLKFMYDESKKFLEKTKFMDHYMGVPQKRKYHRKLRTKARQQFRYYKCKGNITK